MADTTTTTSRPARPRVTRRRIAAILLEERTVEAECDGIDTQLALAEVIAGRGLFATL
jgi:hypothetical protein